MFHATELPAEALPAYRERQAARLRRNLRISLLAGSAVSLAFLPWTRMHDQTNRLPTMELGILLALGLLLLFFLTYASALQRNLEEVTLAGYLYCLSMASVILVVLPNGFLYGVGTLLSFTVVATVLAVDLRLRIVAVMAIAFLLIPNGALLVTDAPWITFMNTNWILLSGGVIAFGLALLMDQSNRNTFLLEHELSVEKARGDALVSTLLPSRIARRLKESDEIIADVQPEATVVFADLVGFTELTRSLSPEELINMLTSVFTTLDELAMDHGLEKIKTIGDSFMAAAGVADAEGQTSADAVEFALESVEAVRHFVVSTGVRLDLRVGLATGPAVSGVIGRRRPHFDMWGTTVNLASRLEASAPPGRVHVDVSTANLLADRYSFEHLGKVLLPGIGEVETCLVDGRVQTPEDDDFRLLGLDNVTAPASD